MIVLIVDDQKQMREQLIEAVREVADEILEADDGVPAMKIIQEKKPDLVLLDVILRGMNGMEVVNELRAKGDQTPIILVTSMGQETASKSLESEVQGYLMKPLIHDLILEKVLEVMDAVGS